MYSLSFLLPATKLTKCLLVVLSLILLTACAAPAGKKEVDDLISWSEKALPKAEKGEMKWSEYYLEVFNRLAAMPPMEGLAPRLKLANIGYEAALTFENGKITKEEFEGVRRQIFLTQSEIIEDELKNQRLRNEEATMNTIQAMQNQISNWKSRTSVNCTSSQTGNTVQTSCR